MNFCIKPDKTPRETTLEAAAKEAARLLLMAIGEPANAILHDNDPHSNSMEWRLVPKCEQQIEIPEAINAASFAEMDEALRKIRVLYKEWQEMPSNLEADEKVDQISEVLERIGY